MRGSQKLSTIKMEENLVYSEIISPGDVIAVGDIHGRMDLYQLFLDHVKDSDATVILLGDLIDRGPDDMAVLNCTRDLLFDPESWGLRAFYALRGNHENMFLDAISASSGTILWWENGGNVAEIHNMAFHEDWVSQLPIYMTVGDTMFIHAGIYPGHDPAKAIADGKTSNLVWMRQPFLTLGPQFYKWSKTLKQIVFGHTPMCDQPYRIPDGVCIDSGAYYTDILTSYNITKNTFNSFTTNP